MNEQLKGWVFTRNCAAVLTILFAATLAANGTDEDGIRALVRRTAQTSVVLFSAAFAASSLRQVWRSPLSTWLIKNRRYVGVSFAYSHIWHLAALIALTQVSPDFTGTVETLTLAGGGFAYLLLIAMAITSNDRAVAALGAKNWGRLHKLGVYLLWILFFQSYAGRVAAGMWIYALPTALLVVVMGIRAYAWRQSS